MNGRPRTKHEDGPRGYRAVFVALLVADIAFAFQQTAVIPAIPTIERDFGSTPEWSAWLLSGYLIVSSAATPFVGRLGDHRGRRRMLLWALGVFLVGSVGAALSPDIAVLVFFRGLQGIGGAVFPLTFALVRDVLPADRLVTAIGALTGGFGIGTALGLGLGGLIAGFASWRLIFAVGGVAIFAGMALVALFVPPSSRRGREGRLDVAGGVLFGGSLAALLLALTEGVSLGWTSGVVVGLFVLACALLAGWVVRELRTENPLIDLHVFGAPAVLRTNLATMTLGYALFGSYFLIPQLVESAHGAAGAGLFLVPGALGQLAAGPLSGAIGRRLRSKWTFAGGMLLAAAGTALLAVWHEEPWQIGPEMFLLGFGMGFGVSSGGNLVTRAVSVRDTGISNALNSVLRRVGGGIGGQVGAVLLATFTTSGGPAQVAFAVAFAVSAVLCLLGAGLAALIPEGRG